MGWTYRTADRRWLMLMMLDESRYWAPTCRALGVTHLMEPYADAAIRRAAWPEICHQLADAIGARNRDELADRLTREGCIFSFVASPPEVVVDPAVVENGYLMAHPTHLGRRGGHRLSQGGWGAAVPPGAALSSQSPPSQG